MIILFVSGPLIKNSCFSGLDREMTQLPLFGNRPWGKLDSAVDQSAAPAWNGCCHSPRLSCYLVDNAMLDNMMSTWEQPEGELHLRMNPLLQVWHQ